jgi:DNA-binding NarL/FixJ family response regulator
MPIRLVLSDDHPIVLEGLASLFHTEPDFQVVATCKDGDETMRALRRHRPDIVVLDLHMPGKDGLTVLREVQQEGLPTRAVILTASLNEDEVIKAVRLGARGVVLKEMAPRMLVQSARKVYGGEEWIERRSFGRALEKLVKREVAAHEITALLTPREVEIMRMISDALRNKDIADRLDITEGTVKIHLHNIYDKLRVNGRLALVTYAREKGLV